MTSSSKSVWASADGILHGMCVKGTLKVAKENPAATEWIGSFRGSSKSSNKTRHQLLVHRNLLQHNFSSLKPCYLLFIFVDNQTEGSPGPPGRRTAR